MGLKKFDWTDFFDKTYASYKNINEKTGGQSGLPILTRSSLRLEQFITASTTQYTFNVLAGVNSPGASTVQPTEVRLEQNDNFHIGLVGIYLATTAASTDTGFRLWTNPNEIILGSAAAQLSYLNLWNGLMKINVNQVDVLTNWRVSQHMFVGQTQRLSASVNNNFDQIDMSNDGLINMDPNIMLSGAYTNYVNITIPTAITSALAANNSRIVIIYDGLRAQNAAVRKGNIAA
jgi:hypothetical protein